MEYKTSRWQEDQPDELGRKSLSHTIFPNCQIREFGPAHILGEFKYRLVLGQHMFSIYEYTQEKEGQPLLTREYVIEGQTLGPTQTPGPTPAARPYFLVAAPASNPKPCIVSAHAVLATLHEPPAPTSRVTPTSSPTSIPSSTPLPTPTDPQPIAAATLEPAPIEPLITAPRILFAGWSLEGDWFTYHTFTPEQDAELDLIVEGPISYPPASLHFYQVSSGETCLYPRLVEVGSGSPTWLPDGKVLLRVSGTWFQGSPCRDDFSNVSDPEFVQAHLPDPGLSPQSTYRAKRVYECRDGLVHNTLTITRVATGQQVNLIKWLEEERIGSCSGQSPGGDWVSDELFLIPETLDQGPLLVKAGQGTTQIAVELFGQQITSCNEESCRSYYASSLPADSSPDSHYLLLAGNRYGAQQQYFLYHPENGEIEKLPYPAIWWSGYSPDGSWLLVDDRPGDHKNLWFRPVDPPGGAFRLFITAAQYLTWSPSGRKIAITGWNRTISVFSFPQGMALGSWDIGGYDLGSVWSPDEKNIVLIGSNFEEDVLALAEISYSSTGLYGIWP